MTIDTFLVGAATVILASWLVHYLRHQLHLRHAEHTPREGTPLSEVGPSARLRDFYRLAVMLEEEGVALYGRLSAQTKDPAVQKLCATLAAEEATHRQRFRSQLDRWNTLPPNPAEWPALLERAKASGIFTDPPGGDATEHEVARFAIRSEVKSAEFYRHFEKAFPDAWRRGKIADLVVEELSHERRLRAVYPGL
jgi:rubrerythrin